MHHIKAFVWDFDGVKYPLTDAMYGVYQQQAITMAMTYLGMTQKEAKSRTRRSLKDHHSNYEFLFLDYGLDREIITREFHAGVKLGPLPAVSALYLQQMQDCGVAHAILTHGDKGHVQRLMADIQNDYPFSHIMTIEDIYPHKKGHSTKPYDMILERMGVQADEALMIEDSPTNLLFARQAGMHTVLLRSNHKTPPHPSIQYVAETPEHLMGAFIEARRNGLSHLVL